MLLALRWGEVPPRPPDDPELEPLVDAASAGDGEAWQELWRRIEGPLAAILRRPSVLGPLSRSDDPVKDVLVALMAKLRDDGFRRLHAYVEARRADPGLTFMRWVVVVAKRVALDRIRADPEYIDLRRSATPGEDRAGLFVETRELPADDAGMPGVRPAFTNRVAAREILHRAEGLLSEAQRRAVEMWSAEQSNEDIAHALGLESPREADRLVRAGVERLRRHFRKELG